MEEIKKKELVNVDGGGISVWGGIGIGAAVVFFIGVLDGFIRPLKCN